MTLPVAVIVEEYERGAWVADVKDVAASDGTFTLGDETWSGTVVETREENEIFYTRIIGGAGGLQTKILDRYYDGRVTLSDVVKAITGPAGETLGTIATASIETYMRITGTAGQCLDRLCDTYGLIWWTNRDGSIDVQERRPSGSSTVSGVRTESGPDGSTVLVNPENVSLGATYESRSIRHVRWYQTHERFEARLYFSPFDVLTKKLDYNAISSARVDSQNDDGTLELIVEGRYSLSKVPYLSGTPTSRVDLTGGDLVCVSFFGGDPRKPFAFATWQSESSHSGGKAVARVDDSVDLGTLAGTTPVGGGVVTFTWTPPGGGTPVVGTSVAMSPGKITIGNTRVRL